jgi:hypothetical protein
VADRPELVRRTIGMTAPGRADYRLVHEASATEVWTTRAVGYFLDHGVGLDGVVPRAPEWHASCCARTRLVPPMLTERDALSSLRDKLADAVAAIDARVAEIDAAARPSSDSQPRLTRARAARRSARALSGEPIDIGPCRIPMWMGCACEDCRARRIRRRRNLGAELQGLRQNIGHAELRVRELVEAGADLPGAPQAGKDEITQLVRALDRKKTWLPKLLAKIAADDARFGSDGRARRTFTHADRAFCRLLFRAGIPIRADAPA